jgi:hypothetical protein
LTIPVVINKALDKKTKLLHIAPKGAIVVGPHDSSLTIHAGRSPLPGNSRLLWYDRILILEVIIIVRVLEALAAM